MTRALFKATENDLQRLSSEELRIYEEIVDLLLTGGMSRIEAEDQAYLSFFTK